MDPAAVDASCLPDGSRALARAPASRGVRADGGAARALSYGVGSVAVKLLTSTENGKLPAL